VWAVLGFSIWVGGTLFNMLVIVPLWSNSPPESVSQFFGSTKFNQMIWNFFGPPWMAVRIVPIFLALISAWPSRFHRYHLLVSAACLTFGIVYTLAYIYPINEILFLKAGRSETPERIIEMVHQWVFADRLRFVVGLVGYVCLLRAFSKTLTFP
jgi:Anthrone oxygenase